jgi:hypothetical protein
MLYRTAGDWDCTGFGLSLVPTSGSGRDRILTIAVRGAKLSIPRFPRQSAADGRSERSASYPAMVADLAQRGDGLRGLIELIATSDAFRSP